MKKTTAGVGMLSLPHPLLGCVHLIVWLVFALGLSPAFAQERVVWSIGTEDQSSHEFSGPVSREPNGDVVFHVGQSRDPAAAGWPGFHPGSSNPRANERLQSYAVEFEAPTGPRARAYALVAGFIFKTPRYPSLVVDINGHKGHFYLQPTLTLFPGDGDAGHIPQYAYQRIEIPFDGAWLQAGKNRIALSCLDEPATRDPSGNSGLHYDFLRLVAISKPLTQRLEARLEPTTFFTQTPEGIKEVCELTLSSGRSASGTAVIRVGDQRFTQQLSSNYEFGHQRYELLVSEFPAKTRAEIVLNTTAGNLNVRVEISPARRWKLYLAPHMHLDVGYTDYQAKVAEVHARNIDSMIDALTASPEYRYNLDGSWIVEQFMATRSPAQRQRFIELARDGRFGLNAWYLNLLTATTSAEELNRVLYYSYDLHKRYGIPFAFANITDIPSQSWSVASFLASAGLRYFASGGNQDRGPFLFHGRMHMHSPYWWEGPDGKRVLKWDSRHYHQVRTLFGLPPSLAAARTGFSTFMQIYSRPDYTPDAVLIYGSQVENEPVSNETGFIREWNAQYVWPRLIPARMDEFFQYVDKNFGSRLPVYRGDGGGYWEDGVGTVARATAAARELSQRLLGAEAITSLNAAMLPTLASPLEQLRRAWNELLLYSEHTITAYNAVRQPDSELSQLQAAVKTGRPRVAGALVDDIILRGLSQLGSQVDVKTDDLLVFNPLSWARSGLVECDIVWGQRGLRDNASSKDVPVEVLWERDGMRRIRFYAEQVPALGYKTYSLVRDGGSASDTTQANVIENKFYRVTVDPQRAAVVSLFDKELQVELVDVKNEFGVNRFLYVASGTESGRGVGREATQLVRSDPILPYAELQITGASGHPPTRLARTPYGQRLRLSAAGPHTSHIDTEVVLYDAEKRIDFINTFEKEEVRAKEAIYFAFPFAVPSPVFRYEIQNGWVNPAENQLPGACSEWFGVQSWVNVSNGSVSVTLSTPDAPLVTLGDINRGQWPKVFKAASPAIFSYALNNYWHTNTPAGQSGRFIFRYSMTSAKVFEGAAAARFGREASHALERMYIRPAERLSRAEKTLPGAQASLLNIDAPGVVLLALKQAEDGNGYVVRFQETAGKKTSGSFSLPFAKIKQAFVANAVEENQSPAVVAGNNVQFSIGAFEVVSIRVMTQ